MTGRPLRPCPSLCFLSLSLNCRYSIPRGAIETSSAYGHGPITERGAPTNRGRRGVPVRLVSAAGRDGELGYAVKTQGDV